MREMGGGVSLPSSSAATGASMATLKVVARRAHRTKRALASVVPIQVTPLIARRHAPGLGPLAVRTAVIGLLSCTTA